ncbi:hypothetical protein BH10ACT3_BH10ACT3_14230 [soil metagenome]
MSSSRPLRILTINGSLRRDSYHGQLLELLTSLAPEGMTFDRLDGLGALPLYDQDLDGRPARPEVQQLRDTIAAADGLVIASPEINHSISAALKNALDWASRPAGASGLLGSHVFAFTASTSANGGLRGLAELSRILRDQGAFVVPQPEVCIGVVDTKLRVDPATGAVELDDPAAVGLLGIGLQVLAASIDTGIGQVLTDASAQVNRFRLEVFAAAQDGREQPADGG